MITLTERERMLRTYRRQEIDRIPMLDLPWAGTLRRWHNEGMPENVAWEDQFGFDKWIRFSTDNSPRFERKLIEQTDRYKIVTTPWGATQKVFNELDSTPDVLDFYYDSSDKWEEAKAAMLLTLTLPKESFGTLWDGIGQHSLNFLKSLHL